MRLGQLVRTWSVVAALLLAGTSIALAQSPVPTVIPPPDATSAIWRIGASG